MELTADTAATRAKLLDTSSSSSSSHDVAPNLYASSGGTRDSETRESAMKNSRVDADKEISAIEALTNANLEVERALDKAHKTLHRLLEKFPLEFEAATKATELDSTCDKRVYTEVYESEADAKIISGKWVLKPHRARYVLRVFSTTMTTSVRMPLSQATDLRNEGYTVFTADAKIVFSTHI